MAAPAKPAQEPPRDERLAAALRENLKRRKAQARAQQDKVNTPPEDKTGS